MNTLSDKFKPVLSIGAAAALINVSVQTLRLYEQKGLILPHKTQSGRRKYSMHDVDRLKQIRRMLIEEGMNLNGVRSLLSFIPCWSFKGGYDKDCEQCPAAFETREPCWNIKNVGAKCQEQDCRVCPVYQLNINHERLKEIFYPKATLLDKEY